MNQMPQMMIRPGREGLSSEAADSRNREDRPKETQDEFDDCLEGEEEGGDWVFRIRMGRV